MDLIQKLNISLETDELTNHQQDNQSVDDIINAETYEETLVNIIEKYGTELGVVADKKVTIEDW